MQKLVSLSAVLLFLVGIFAAMEPAGALPYCSCAGCALTPNATCISREDSGFRMPCPNYFYDYCTSAPGADQAAVGTEFFPLELLGVAAPEARLSPLLPVAKPGC